MSETKIIIGLGNPGNDYEYTRHNLGFLVVRYLSEQYKLKFELSSFTNGLTAKGKIDDQDVCLVMPLTYMNKSGVAVRQVFEYYKVTDFSDALVICDDMNIGFGQIRLKPSGSDGGNNGLKSIIALLNSNEFPRLRMGIGKPGHRDLNVDYVLSEFTKEEQKQLEDFISEAAQCCGVWLKEGIAKAMDQFNKRKENGK